MDSDDELFWRIYNGEDVDIPDKPKIIFNGKVINKDFNTYDFLDEEINYLEEEFLKSGDANYFQKYPYVVTKTEIIDGNKIITPRIVFGKPIQKPPVKINRKFVHIIFCKKHKNFCRGLKK